MRNEVIELIRELSGAREVCETDEFRSVGIDSISYVRLVVEIEEKYDIAFDDDELILDDIKYIAEFVRIAEEKCKRKHCTE